MASGADETPPGQQDDTSVVVDPTGSPRPSSRPPTPLLQGCGAASTRTSSWGPPVVRVGLETDSKI